MRIGLLGPAEEEPALIKEAAEFLLGDCGADQTIYLGAAGTLQHVVRAWSLELRGGVDSGRSFYEEAAELALTGGSSAIDALLERDRELKRLATLRALPTAPGRSIELFDDKVVLFVHDKAVLDQEDIANAFLIVYGRSRQVAMHRFGPRTFFTPGPLKGGAVALIERELDGSVAIAQFDPHTGEPRGRDIVPVRRTRMIVTP
jgi:hypothetical protein